MMEQKKRDDWVHMYRHLPEARAIWDLARSETERRKGRVNHDDSDVIWLRDLLWGVFEAGKGRTAAQTQALDNMMERILRNEPLAIVLP